MAPKRKIAMAQMSFAGYTVVALGATIKEAKDAVRESVKDSGYWKESEWASQPWSAAWEYFGGHADWMTLGRGEWQ